jgi:hypothetical protein
MNRISTAKRRKGARSAGVSSLVFSYSSDR